MPGIESFRAAVAGKPILKDLSLAVNAGVCSAGGAR